MLVEALVRRTAQLYKVNVEPPPSPIGRNTAHAIQSGLFWGYLGFGAGLGFVFRVCTSPIQPERAPAT